MPMRAKKRKTHIHIIIAMFMQWTTAANLTLTSMRGWYCKQTSANCGPDSKFVLEAIIKALISKLSRSSIMFTDPNYLERLQV